MGRFFGPCTQEQGLGEVTSTGTRPVSTNAPHHHTFCGDSVMDAGGQPGSGAALRRRPSCSRSLRSWPRFITTQHHEDRRRPGPTRYGDSRLLHRGRAQASSRSLGRRCVTAPCGGPQGTLSRLGRDCGLCALFPHSQGAGGQEEGGEGRKINGDDAYFWHLMSRRRFWTLPESATVLRTQGQRRKKKKRGRKLTMETQWRRSRSLFSCSSRCLFNSLLMVARGNVECC